MFTSILSPLEGDSAEQKAPGGAFCEREGTKCRRGLDKDDFLPRFFDLNILRHLIGEKYKVSTYYKGEIL